MNTTFDPKKECTTRDGRKVRILCTDLDNRQPIVAVVVYDGRESVERYSADGTYYLNGSQSCCDLVNLPEPKKWRAWKPEEVPVGALFRSGDDAGTRNAMMIVEAENSGVYIVRSGRIAYVPTTDMLGWFYSLDSGRSWQKCGVEE